MQPFKSYWPHKIFAKFFGCQYLVILLLSCILLKLLMIWYSWRQKLILNCKMLLLVHKFTGLSLWDLCIVFPDKILKEQKKNLEILLSISCQYVIIILSICCHSIDILLSLSCHSIVILLSLCCHCQKLYSNKNFTRTNKNSVQFQVQHKEKIF